jgi:hypothetical protein
MKNVFKSPKAYMLAGLLVIVVTASAWQLKDKKQKHDTTAHDNNIASDTANPRKHDFDKDDYGMKDFEQSMKQLDIQLKNLDVNLGGLDTVINKSVRQALANIDFAKIGRDVDDAVKSVDWNEINNTINGSLKTALESLKNIDADKIRLDVQDELDKINSKDFNIHFDGAELGKTINDAVNNAMGSIGGLTQWAQDWSDLTKGLEKDGLIDRKKGYKIEWKDNGELYINGTRQPKN